MRSFPKGTFLGVGISIIVVSIIQMASGIGIGVSLCGGSPRCFTDDSLSFISIGPTVLNIITGSLGIGAACSRVGHKRSGLKNGFMVMCILSALGSLYTSYLFFIIIASSRSAVTSIGLGFRVGGIVAGLWVAAISAVILFILCVIGASFSCCCSPVNEDKDRHAPSDHTNSGYRDDRRHY